MATHYGIQEVCQALHAVYSGSGERHSTADRWLQVFQKSPEAWKISDDLLRLPEADLQVKFFASLTIHQKIRYDFSELPQESLVSLRASLCDHLATSVIANDYSPAVVTRLCLAIAAFAVQTNWHRAVEDISGHMFTSIQAALGDQLGNNAFGIAKAKKNVLELLEVLPEECNDSKIIVAEQTREGFYNELVRSVPALLNLLQGLSVTETSEPILEYLFKCLQSWIRHSEIPADAVAKTNILQLAFEKMNTPSLFEPAIDLLVETLRTYYIPSNSMPVVQIMVPRAIALNRMYCEACIAEDDDTTLGLCRLFTEMGESYIDIIVGPLNVGQDSLIDMLLMCTRHNSNDIASICLPFWHRLCLALIQMEDQQPHKETKLKEFVPYLQSLLGALNCLMLYPEDIEKRPLDQIEDIDMLRYDVMDAIGDCCRVMGATMCLTLFVRALEMEMQSFVALPPDAQLSRWQFIEACLNCIRSIAKYFWKQIPLEDPWLGYVVVTLGQQIFPSVPFLRRTSCRLIGDCSHWLNAHIEYLEPAFQFVVDSLNIPKCSSSSANAICLLCKSCSIHIGKPVLALYDQLISQEGREIIKHKEELDVLEGLCHVVSDWPMDAIDRTIQRIAEHCITMMSNLLGKDARSHEQALNLGGGDSSAYNDRVRRISNELNKLTVIVQHVKPKLKPEEGIDHPVMKIVNALWQLLGTVADTYPTSDNLAEKLCRFYKHAMRTSGQYFEPFLEPFVKWVVESFAKSSHSSYLYCFSVCIGEYGCNPSHHAGFRQVMEHLSNITFSKLKDFEAFVSNPDVVEEYFFLVARLLEHHRELLLEGITSLDLLHHIVQRMTIGMKLHHREALMAVLKSTEQLILVCAVLHHVTLQHSATNSLSSDQGSTAVATGHRDLAWNILSTHGSALTASLINVISSEAPGYAVDARQGSAGSLLWRLRFLCQDLQQWAGDAFQNLPETLVPPALRQSFLEALFSSGNNPCKDDFLRSVEMFSKACSRHRQRNCSP